jgi:hypothetical protein
MTTTTDITTDATIATKPVVTLPQTLERDHCKVRAGRWWGTEDICRTFRRDRVVPLGRLGGVNAQMLCTSNGISGVGRMLVPASRRRLSTPGDGNGSLMTAVLGVNAGEVKHAHSAQPASSQDGGPKLAADEPSSLELYCTGVPTTWNREELRQLFEPLGPVASVTVPQHVVKLPDGLNFASFIQRPCLSKDTRLHTLHRTC